VREYLRGWIGYFGRCETPSVLEELAEVIDRGGRRDSVDTLDRDHHVTVDQRADHLHREQRDTGRTLDDPGLFGKPQMAIFTVDKQPFHQIPDGLPAFERLPKR